MNWIPKSFWNAVSTERGAEIIMRGYLNEEDCKLLWKLTDRNTEPPERMELWIDPKKLKDLLGRDVFQP